MSKINDKAVYLEANGLNKTLKQAIIDGDLSGGGGSQPKLIYSETIICPAGSSSMTGLCHVLIPSSMTINIVKIRIFEKNGISSGIFEVDVKKGADQNNASLSTILSANPQVDFSTASDYSIGTGTISSGSVVANDVIRIDVTQKPVDLMKFIIMVYAI